MITAHREHHRSSGSTNIFLGEDQEKHLEERPWSGSCLPNQVNRKRVGAEEGQQVTLGMGLWEGFEAALLVGPREPDPGHVKHQERDTDPMIGQVTVTQFDI